MTPSKKSLVVPILLIAIGTGWLLSALDVTPDIDWVWTLGLAAVGLSTFAVCGFDKATVVIGPLFILASCLSFLRQTERLHIDVEVPILVIATGVLVLCASAAAIPAPKWMIENQKKER